MGQEHKQPKVNNYSKQLQNMEAVQNSQKLGRSLNSNRNQNCHRDHAGSNKQLSKRNLDFAVRIARFQQLR